MFRREILGNLYHIPVCSCTEVRLERPDLTFRQFSESVHNTSAFLHEAVHYILHLFI